MIQNKKLQRNEEVLEHPKSNESQFPVGNDVRRLVSRLIRKGMTAELA